MPSRFDHDDEFDREMNDFETRYQHMRNYFFLFFKVVAVIVLLIWALTLFLIYRAATTTPEEIGNTLGEIAKGFEEGKK